MFSDMHPECCPLTHPECCPLSLFNAIVDVRTAGHQGNDYWLIRLESLQSYRKISLAGKFVIIRIRCVSNGIHTGPANFQRAMIGESRSLPLLSPPHLLACTDSVDIRSHFKIFRRRWRISWRHGRYMDFMNSADISCVWTKFCRLWKFALIAFKTYVSFRPQTLCASCCRLLPTRHKWLIASHWITLSNSSLIHELLY